MGDVGDFLVRIAPPRAEAEVVFDGPKPDSPKQIEQLIQWDAKWSTRYVYMFLTDGWATYIGRSEKPHDRFRVHRPREWCRGSNGYVLVRLPALGSYDHHIYLERQAIRMFGPTHNRAGVQQWPGITLAS